MRFRGFVVFAVALACTGGSPAEPGADASFDALPDGPSPSDDAGDAGDAEAGFAVCPPGLQPSFKSIDTMIFKTDSCGTDRGGKCHSDGGGVFSGGLDLSTNAYVHLVGDGGGAPAENIGCTACDAGSLRRVVPGDPAHSFLFIKLSTKTGSDPNYGSGMPFDFPGSVCPATLDTIKTWIMNGAIDDEADGGASDAGPG